MDERDEKEKQTSAITSVVGVFESRCCDHVLPLEMSLAVQLLITLLFERLF